MNSQKSLSDSFAKTQPTDLLIEYPTAAFELAKTDLQYQ